MKKHFLTFLLTVSLSLPAMAEVANTAEDKLVQASVLYCLTPLQTGTDPAQTATQQKLNELPAETAKTFKVDRAFLVTNDAILGTRSPGPCSIFIKKLDYDNFLKVTDYWLVKKLSFKPAQQEENGGLLKSYRGKLGDSSFLIVVRARKTTDNGELQGLITVGTVANE